MAFRNFTNYSTFSVPQIQGAKGGKGGGAEPHTPIEHPQSLFSTDILFVVVGLGEGPLYRINPNGPQDVELGDNTIDDLINLDGNGLENTSKFKILSNTGTTTQNRLDVFGETVTTPQNFASPVTLRSGGGGIPASQVTLQETSSKDWDAISFNFAIGGLQRITDKGDVLRHSLSVSVTVFDHTGTTTIATASRTVSGKTTVAFKFTIKVQIPEASKNVNGYRFSIRKTSGDGTSSGTTDDVSIQGWNEIENSPQAYPRTAHIGYALKATDEHNGIPTFTSLVKGLIHKVPSNYNQPTLSTGEIDWRHVEVPATGAESAATAGYFLQQTGTTLLTSATINIYNGTWDGTFAYSWSQNPVWIIYDLLTNKTYGLGVPEENIDKYRFYQIAQFCDACDYTTGNFIGVDGLADGTFRSKARGTFTSNRERQLGVAQGTVIKERRFTLDLIIADQSESFDTINSLAASFRGAVLYAHGKITLACDLPDETPVMVFNEATMKENTFIISGNKESDILTGVDVSYVDPTNHYKRETVRIDQLGSNDGITQTEIENITSLDLVGVTRRSQALRFAQYQIAASRYLKRTTTFTTGTDALQLVPGDVISVAQQASGVAYGFGGKIRADSAVTPNNTNVFLEHYTVPSLSASNFGSSNTSPLALRIIKVKSDRIDLYLVSNANFTLTTTDDVTSGFDQAIVNPIERFNPITKSWDAYTAFTANNKPEAGDLWTFGEIDNPDNFYTSKSDKLFKVTQITRETDDEEVAISAVEYISNVYIDSDKFIDYKPTAYTDIQSSLTVPPVPQFNFIASPRTRSDGSIAVDGLIQVNTDREGFGISYVTEYEISKPTNGSLIANNIVVGDVNTVQVVDANVLVGAPATATLVGKNGFTSAAGEIKLLCTAIENTDTSGGTSDGTISLTIQGFGQVFDDNFQCNVLDANDDNVFGTLKGADQITIPVNQNVSAQGLLNFVGFAPVVTALSRTIVGHTAATDIIKITNTRTDDETLLTKIPPVPFYVTINQLLDSRFYANNTFYVSGSEFTHIQSGEIDDSASDSITIDLPVRPRDAAFVRLFIDGEQKTAGQFTVNHNNPVVNATVVYAKGATDSAYRTEVDYYSVPIIERGDNVQAATSNIFSVIETTYDPESTLSNVALTANNIYKIKLATSPKANLGGLFFTNISSDPTGFLGNIAGGTATLDYNRDEFPGRFTLANNRVYNLQIGSDFEQMFLTKDQVIPGLLQGTTAMRARNKTRGGRTSAFNTKFIHIDNIPIQKVKNATIVESLYREQTGGVAVRATVQFDHIFQQNVTDYEISYRMDSVDDVGVDDGGTDLTSFNTVKVPASGLDSDNKIRFTVNGINRGLTSDTRNIIFRIVPLNKEIRGLQATLSKSIVGKTAKPANVFNFTGGQQIDQITLLWSYARTSDGELADLDLKEVVIKRLPGEIHGATVDDRINNFVAASDLVTVSAGTARKSIPIDTYGEFTYLARTRDTSGNFSEDVVDITLTTSRPIRSTVVAAYNEDAPSVNFTNITNTNNGETNFPSFSDSTTGGLAYGVRPGIGGVSSATDNANGTSSGWSATSSATDLLASGSGEYITQIRDFGSTVTGAVYVEIQGTQSVQTNYNSAKEAILTGVTDPSGTAGVLKDASFGGIGTVLGFSNTAVVDPRFDSNNTTWMSGGASGNVYVIWNDGQYVGNVIAISAITKASPAVVTTAGSEHGLVNGNRIIIHDINGMTQLNNRELYVNRVNATSVQLYTDTGRTSALDSSGFGTYTSSGVLDQGDYANANSYAHIAGLVDADEIRLGETYHSNGDSTGGNALGNVTTAASNYKLVNMRQYSDSGTGDTYAGSLGAVRSQTLIRTTTVDNTLLYVGNVSSVSGGSDGNVNIEQFVGSSVNEGFQTYQAGSRTFRQFQLKFIVQNDLPDEFDFTIDKFRYTIEKDTVTFTDTTAYNATTKTIDITDAGFLTRPVVSYAMLNEDSNKPHIVVTTAASNQAVSYQVFKSSDGSAGSTSAGMSVMMTATGV